MLVFTVAARFCMIRLMVQALDDGISIPNFSITQRLSQKLGGKIPFSMEFYPPRNAEEETRLWKSLYTIVQMDALFASVTYRAGGISAHHSFQVSQYIQNTFNLPVLSHLTTVGQTREELLGHAQYMWDNHLRHVLALRGDPPEDPLAEWKPTPGGVDYAKDLMELLHSVAPFELAVAAFPEGHFRALNLDMDTKILVEKLAAGAEFAITQMFFDVDDFLRLRDRIARANSHYADVPIIPGVMPITSLRVVRKLLALSGSTLPHDVNDQLEKASQGDEQQHRSEVRKAGIEIATRMAERLIAEGVPCIQFCTLNYTKSTRDVLGNLGVNLPDLSTVPDDPERIIFPQSQK